jgi:hypothetical protein
LSNITVDAQGRITAASSGTANTDNIAEGNSSVVVTDTDTNGTIAFTTDDQRAMTIDSSQRVGIGTQSPGSILTTEGGYITCRQSGGANIGFIGPADNTVSGGGSSDFGISTAGGSLLFGSGGTNVLRRSDSALPTLVPSV